MPGFTHMQPAQPVTFGHHLLAYVEMFGRDRAVSRMRAPGSMNARWAPRRSPAHLFHRPRHDSGSARLRSADRQFARQRSDRDFVIEALAGGRDLRRRICRVSPRRSSSGRRRNSAFCDCPTSFRPAPRSCRRSAIPMRPNSCAANPAASSAPCRAPDRAEGPAARLFQGHAGGQGRHVRCARDAFALSCGDERHGAAISCRTWRG